MAIAPKILCGVVVSSGKMMRAVKVRTAKQVYHSFLKKVDTPPICVEVYSRPVCSTFLLIKIISFPILPPPRGLAMLSASQTQDKKYLAISSIS